MTNISGPTFETNVPNRHACLLVWASEANVNDALLGFILCAKWVHKHVFFSIPWDENYNNDFKKERGGKAHYAVMMVNQTKLDCLKHKIWYCIKTQKSIKIWQINIFFLDKKKYDEDDEQGVFHNWAWMVDFPVINANSQ